MIVLDQDQRLDTVLDLAEHGRGELGVDGLVGRPVAAAKDGAVWAM
jgi:hypothetical protein